MSKIYEVSDKNYYKYLVKAKSEKDALRIFKKHYPKEKAIPKLTSYYSSSMKSLVQYNPVYKKQLKLILR